MRALGSGWSRHSQLRTPPVPIQTQIDPLSATEIFATTFGVIYIYPSHIVWGAGVTFADPERALPSAPGGLRQCAKRRLRGDSQRCWAMRRGPLYHPWDYRHVSSRLPSESQHSEMGTRVAFHHRFSRMPNRVLNTQSSHLSSGLSRVAPLNSHIESMKRV